MIVPVPQFELEIHIMDSMNAGIKYDHRIA